MLSATQQRSVIAALVITSIGMIVGFWMLYEKTSSESPTLNVSNTNVSNTNSSVDPRERAAFDSGYSAGTIDGASKTSAVGQRFNPIGEGRLVLQYEDGYMQGYVYGCGQSGKDCIEVMQWFSKVMTIQGLRYTQ